MRQIDRHSLVDKIARELQKRMTYDDIRVYLAGFKFEMGTTKDSYGSKWVYSKDLLAGASPEILIRIADELEIPHGFTVTTGLSVVESRFWEPSHFRLFLSHLSSLKDTMGRLQSSLRRFGISAFVAHVDIDPTKEWQDEIEAALFSMDALAAILMTGFRESNWTDQEVGVAIGRDALVIPVMRGSTPHGFIGKYQGMNAVGKTVAEVAEGLFEILLASPKTRSRMLTCLVDTTTQATSEREALDRLAVLKGLKDVPVTYAERLRDGAIRSQVFGRSAKLHAALNELLRKRGIPAVSFEEWRESASKADDEVSF
jgi:TIR domain